jgi:hypothetical protein
MPIFKRPGWGSDEAIVLTDWGVEPCDDGPRVVAEQMLASASNTHAKNALRNAAFI